MSRIFIIILMLSPVFSWAQNCNNHVHETTPTKDFIDHGDGTVTHTKTGLMWMKCTLGKSGPNCENGSETEFNWQEALQAPSIANKDKGIAGYNDWRLPNKNELISIVEQHCYDPAINLDLFPSTRSKIYWTSSNYAAGNKFALFVDFFDGDNIYAHRYKQLFVRLVRGGE